MSTFPLAFLSTLKSSSIAAVSGVSIVRNVVMDNVMLHSKYSLWGQASTASLSILLGRDHTFPMMMDGRTGLYLLRLAWCLVKPQSPCLLLILR